MKNRLLPLFFVLGAFSAYSQVGVGTLKPNGYSQLDVVSDNKGVLIPRVGLKSSTDTSTVVGGTETGGYPNSLLVFNTNLIADVKPGYYYWYENKWYKIATPADVNNNFVEGKGAPAAKGEPGYPGENVSFYKDTTTGSVYVQNGNGSWSNLNGKNGLDGKDGMSGGNGVPGAPGTPGIDGTIQMYVDYTTGIVYVRDPKDNTKWVSLNGKNGLDGKNGISGGTGVPGAPGTPGIDGTIQMYVDYATGIVYVRDPQDNTKWVPLNGKNGLDGKNGISGGTGVPGAPGTPGIDGTIQMYVDYATGIVYVRDPQDNTKWVPLNGKNGLDGKNGISGGTGVPGAPGTPGIDGTIQMYVDYNTGIVYVRDPQDNTKWVPLNGKNGLDGKNGISGGTGVPGAPGTPGIDGTIQMYVDYATGIVYVRDPKDNTKWVPLNGKNGLDGKNGISGGAGLPGDKGLDGTVEMYIDYTTGTVYVRDPKNHNNWIRVSEIVTTLNDNGAGKYTYINEEEKAFTIDVVNDVKNNFQTIANDTKVADIIKNISKKAIGNVTYDANSKEFSYVDASGNSKVINIADLVKLGETVTTLNDNGAGKYTYINEKGDEVTINVVNDVTNNFQTIANDTAVTNIIKDIVKKTNGNVTYDANSKEFSYVDASGNSKVINIADLVKLGETVTTLNDNGAGKYTYINEKGDEVTINVVNDVKNNFQTIANDTAVTNIIKDIVKKTNGNVTYNATTQEFSYVDAAGNTKVINIADLVKLGETVTTISDNGVGSYTYKNEKGDEVTINVVNDVKNNFQTIANDAAVTNIIKDIVKKTNGNVTYNATTQEFSYVDAAGNSKVINIADLVKLGETVTTISDNGVGSYTYKNEKGDEVTINVVNDVTNNFQTIANNPAVTNIIKEIVKKTDGNVTYNGTTNEFSYTDANGNSKVINIADLVKLSETVTTINNDGKGNYTYKNEKGDLVTIAVVNDVADNFQTIVNNPAVTNIIENIVKKTGGNVTFDGAKQEFSYTDANGNPQVINIADLVKLSETVTTLSNDGAGSYTYKNEKGDSAVINVVNDVADNFQTIVNNPAVTNIIENIVKKTGGNVTFDGAKQEFSYTDANGNPQVINIADLVKLSETVTTLSNDGAGSYTYKNEKGDSAVINVVNDVADNFQTIVNNPAVTNIIENIVKKTGGNVTFDGAKQEFSYTDANGNPQVINIADLVKLSETVTTLSNDGAGSYTYKNEKGDSAVINVVNDVADNFQTIVNNPAVTNIIENIVKKTGGNVTFDGAKQEFSYTDANGNPQVINIADLVKLSETVTTLSNDGAGSYTYKNEKGDSAVINVVNDVADNFQTIVNNPAVTNIIENIVKKTGGNVTYDAAKQEFSYTDANGNPQVINIADLVKLSETVTTLSNDGAGSYTYKNEKGDSAVINVVNDVADNFQTIVNNPAVTNIIENIVKKTGGNVTYDAAKQEFSYTDANGNPQVINIADLVKLSETVTTLSNDGKGSYTYKNEKGDLVTINVVNDVTENFQTIANNPDVNTIIENIVKKTGGNVTYDAAKQEFSYTDANGNPQVINIADLVKLSETVTTLSNDGKGSYTYKNEKGDLVTINVVNDVTENFQTIANNPDVNTIIENIVKKTGGNVTYDAAKQEFSYTDANGNPQVINIADLVKLSETVTTLSNDGKGSYTYKNEKGDLVTINVVNDVADNFQTIVNNPDVTNIIKDIVKKTDGNVMYDAATKEFSYTDASGVKQVINLEQIVTTLTNNGAGSYTYKNEAGTDVTINVVNDVTENFQTIANNPDVNTIIENIVKKTGGNVTYDAAKQEFSYTDANGNPQVINIADLVKLSETLTTLSNDGKGSYTYKNEKGDLVTINVVNDVAENFQTIVNNPDVTNIIKDIVKKTDGNVMYDAATKEFSYTDASGVKQVINLEQIVTTLTNNGAGSYTYKNEAGTDVTINVVNDVTENFQTIANNPDVNTIIENIVKKTGGNVTYDAAKQEFSYTDANGNPQVINIADLVKLSETVTTLSNDGAGSYTYKNEKGDSAVINVVNDVADNFQTIVNNPAVTNIIENIVKKTGGNVTYDGAKQEFSYTDANGNPQVINIADLVKLSETVTTLSNDGKGSYTYKNEKGDLVTINVVNDVAENFQTIANNPDVNTIIENIVKKTGGNVTYDAAKQEFSYTDANGNPQVINIADLVKLSETVTTLSNDGKGSYTYKNEKGDLVTINVVKDVTDNFQTIASDPGVNTIIEDIVKKTGGGYINAGTNISITGSGTQATPFVISATVPQQAIDEFNASAGQTNFTLGATPSALSQVRLYINGVRIHKNAISVTGNVLTYNAANNGSYALMANDTIMIDYLK